MKFFLITAALLLPFSYISSAEEPVAPEQIKIEQAEKLVEDGAQLLDVRTKEEWDEGHVKGATLVTVTEDGFLEKAMAKLDKEKEVVVYCRSGGRSAVAAKQLRAAGFKVHDVKGGILAWVAAGKTLEKWFFGDFNAEILRSEELQGSASWAACHRH